LSESEELERKDPMNGITPSPNSQIGEEAYLHKIAGSHVRNIASKVAQATPNLSARLGDISMIEPFSLDGEIKEMPVKKKPKTRIAVIQPRKIEPK
jgi:hypothetical protein